MQSQAGQQWKRQHTEGAAGGSRDQHYPQCCLKLVDNLNYKRPVKEKVRVQGEQRERREDRKGGVSQHTADRKSHVTCTKTANMSS